jgi:hypothetical protein
LFDLYYLRDAYVQKRTVPLRNVTSSKKCTAVHDWASAHIEQVREGTGHPLAPNLARDAILPELTRRRSGEASLDAAHQEEETAAILDGHRRLAEAESE